MIVLGIETSTEVGSVALIKDKVVLGEITLNQPRNHSAQLIPAIGALLSLLGVDLEDLEGISVGLGPGSFTGLRVGLSTAKGLALALGKPLVGIPSPDALARNFPVEGLLCILMDAKRGLLYMGLYRDGERIGPLRAVSPLGALEALRGKKVTLVGDGVRLYPEVFEDVPGFRIYPPPVHPSAAAVALLGEERLRHGQPDDLSGLTPLYLRPPDAELKEEKRGDP